MVKLEDQNSIVELDEIVTQKINGLVSDLHLTKYGNIKATIKLKGHEDLPVTVDIPYTNTIDGKSPIQLNDWLTIETRVIRLGDLKK
jgi:hypothetical protein